MNRKIKIESKTEYGPCGDHEKYAILFIVFMFIFPFLVIFLS